jgi:hypothetical protein
MKKLITVIFLVFPCILIAQEQLWYPGEMYLGTANVNPPSQTITFTIEAQGEVWAGSYPPRTYWITENYHVSTFTPHANNEWPPNYWRGWDFVTDITNNPPYYIPIYAYGLYKLSTNHSSKYFYLDFRDDRYGYYGWYQPPTFGHNIDLWIKYDANTQEFSYSSLGSEPFNTISNAQLIPIWEMKQKGQQNTSLFPNYWQNCLVAIPSPDNHPMLVWGPYPYNIGIYAYRIYRNYGGWELLATVDDDEFTYVDETLSLTPPGGQAGTDVYYYIKGVYIENPPNPIETSASNTVIVNVPGDDIDKKSVSNNNNENFEYNLTQNFPNPFNPSTIISYSLPVSGQVTLKVFDILGIEVAELVNEQKEAGKHTIKFDASNLTSGIYFYKIESDKFLQTRKMMIIK